MTEESKWGLLREDCCGKNATFLDEAVCKVLLVNIDGDSGGLRGNLWLESPEPPGSASLYYGGWGLSLNLSGPKFEANQLYQAVFTLRSESTEAQQYLPLIRLRIGNRTFNWVGQRSIRQVPGAP